MSPSKPRELGSINDGRHSAAHQQAPGIRSHTRKMNDGTETEGCPHVGFSQAEKGIEENIFGAIGWLMFRFFIWREIYSMP